MGVRTVDEEKLAALIASRNELAKLSKDESIQKAVNIDDLGEDPLPSWFKWETFESAIVDFSDRVPGVSLRLVDSTVAGGFEIQKANIASGGEISTELVAAWLKNHFGEILDEKRGPDGQTSSWPKVFVSDPPKKAAALADWKKWVESLGEKNTARLVRASIIFRRGIGAAGN